MAATWELGANVRARRDFDPISVPLSPTSKGLGLAVPPLGSQETAFWESSRPGSGGRSRRSGCRRATRSRGKRQMLPEVISLRFDGGDLHPGHPIETPPPSRAFSARDLKVGPRPEQRTGSLRLQRDPRLLSLGTKGRPSPPTHINAGTAATSGRPGVFRCLPMQRRPPHLHSGPVSAVRFPARSSLAPGALTSRSPFQRDRTCRTGSTRDRSRRIAGGDELPRSGPAGKTARRLSICPRGAACLWLPGVRSPATMCHHAAEPMPRN